VFRLIILTTKGIIRDARMRRKAMLWLIGAAVVMLFAGSLLPDSWARANPWPFLIYWIACGWLTLAGVLLALLEILVVRVAARATERRLEREFAQHLKPDEKQGDDE
jgi:hypothetical protein